jgi:hypothetical protein
MFLLQMGVLKSGGNDKQVFLKSGDSLLREKKNKQKTNASSEI